MKKFPDDYIFHRNDRISRGGGVFTGVKKNLVATKQTELVTQGEIEWTKVKMKIIGIFIYGHFICHTVIKRT